MVHNAPLLWHDQAIGALNLFRVLPTPLTSDEAETAQRFADVATLALAQSPELSLAEVLGRVSEAMRGRVLVEQAKGVLAHRQGLDVAAAYAALVQLAERRGLTLTETATGVVAEAVGRASTA